MIKKAKPTNMTDKTGFINACLLLERNDKPIKNIVYNKSLIIKLLGGGGFLRVDNGQIRSIC